MVTLLQCIDLIDIHSEDESDIKELKSVLKIYRDNCVSPAYEECRKLSSKILDKWYSRENQITTTYANFRGVASNQK